MSGNAKNSYRKLQVFIIINDPYSGKITQRAITVDASLANDMETKAKAERELNFLNRLARSTWTAYYELVGWINDETKVPGHILQYREEDYRERTLQALGKCDRHPGAEHRLIRNGFTKAKLPRWTKVCVGCKREAYSRWNEKSRKDKSA